MQKVFVENGSQCYHTMFTDMGFHITDDIEEATLVCFTGGADVEPDLYGEDKHPTTRYHAERDDQCLELFNTCIRSAIPMVGICRGSQFLCVANEGKLWQDVDGHTQDHMALDYNGDVFAVTSTHHQEMRPKGGRVLLTARSGTYRSNMVDGVARTIAASTPTIESVCWTHSKCLSVQGHPEFRDASPKFKAWFALHVYKLVRGEL